MSKSQQNKMFDKSLFKRLFKDLGFYLLAFVLSILIYASIQVFNIYLDLGNPIWFVLIVTAFLLVSFGLLVYFYRPISVIMIIPVGSLFFAFVFNVPILFKVSLITAIIYPIWVLVNNYVEFKNSKKEIRRKFYGN